MTHARDIMTKNVIFVDPDDTVERAIEQMLQFGISGLPVIDSGDQLLGVVTEFDILDMVTDLTTERNRVYHYMTRNPRTIDAEMSVYEVAQMFRESSIRRFPVVDHGRVVGIISRRELIRLVHNLRARVRRRDVVLC